MPKPKYRLHATKVDRIAIVDRPAVPNAEILLFKRKGEVEEFDLEKVIVEVLEKSQFGDSFIYGATMSAIDSLEGSFWNTLIINGKDKALITKGIDELFAEFSATLAKLFELAKTREGTSSKQEITVAYPSPDSLLSSFRQGIASQNIQSVFQSFRNNLGFLIMDSGKMPEAEKAIELLTAEVKSIVTQNFEEIIPKEFKEVDTVELLKIGRKISSARMAKLREAFITLQDIIKEQEGESTRKSEKEKGDDMTLEAITKAVETLKAQLAEISAQLAKIEEGKALKADKADVEKSISELKVEIEALKTAVKTASEALKPITDALTPLNEKIAKVEKMEKDLESLTGIVDAVKKSHELLNKGIETIGKRFGVKTSVDVEKGAEGEAEGKDTFGEALKGKTK